MPVTTMVLSAVIFGAGFEPAAGDAAALRARVDTLVEIARRNAPEIGTAPPVEVIHAIIAFGRDAEVREPGGRRRNAILHLCTEMRWNGVPIFLPDRSGVGVTPGMQGHRDQIAAVLAVAGVAANQTIRIEGKHHTAGDLYSAARLRERTAGENAWTLLALLHDGSTGAATDAEIVRLLDAVLQEMPAGAACGGTHALSAVTAALKRPRAGATARSEVWAKAQRAQADHVRRALQHQGADGAFSAKYFEGPAEPKTPWETVRTTGHILEWLMTALDDKAVADPRIARAADRLARAALELEWTPEHANDLHHALHALLLHRQRTK